MSDSFSPPSRAHHIAIIGAGVVGLTTALHLLERGHGVTLLSEHLPGDRSIKYTSPWAGAHHVSFAREGSLHEQLDRETFEWMWAMREREGEEKCGLMKITETEFFEAGPPPGLSFLECMPDYRVLPPSSLPPGITFGVSFSTLTIDTPHYLPYLLTRGTSLGLHVQRVALQHVREALARVPAAEAVVVCAGIGARFLGGVEDRTVYPTRGQTVTLWAPWVKSGCARNEEGKWDLGSYVIPRKSGEVIIGGSRDVDDWDPTPRPALTESIISRALALCPELAPSSARTAGRTPTPADLQILTSSCGLRPSRKDGVRIEADALDVGDGRQVLLVHNYGHGGWGYQSSWGSAVRAGRLVEQGLGLAKVKEGKAKL